MADPALSGVTVNWLGGMFLSSIPNICCRWSQNMREQNATASGRIMSIKMKSWALLD